MQEFENYQSQVEDEPVEFKVEDLYTKPKGPFNQSFIRACENNFGKIPEAARWHYKMLQRIPEGYRYHGLARADYDMSVFPREIIIVSDDVYNGDGKHMPGYVAIAMKAE